MKVVTSATYHEPTFERGMVRLVRLKAGSYPEFVDSCKWVDKSTNQVFIFEGLTKERILTNGSKKRLTASKPLSL